MRKLSSRASRLALSTALLLLAAHPAAADDLVQAPQLAAPQRGSLAGENAQFAPGPNDLGRGTFQLPSPLGVPSDRGALPVAIFPSYSPGAGLSEWGLGWGTHLEVSRTRLLGTIDYATDDLAGPWGRMVKGQDGAFYALDLGAKVRLTVVGDGTLEAVLPSGDRYTFGAGGARFDTARGTYTWYLTDVVTVTGRRLHLAWSRPAGQSAGRMFLGQATWGFAGDWQYEIDLAYEPIPYLFVSYLSGAEATLDRRVSTVTVRAKSALTGSFDERWHYVLGYQQEALGPAFYLSRIDQLFASGEAAPTRRFTYRLAEDALPTRALARAPFIEKLMTSWGTSVIQPAHSTLLDADDDGRPDLEEASANTLLTQTDSGFVATALPTAPAGTPAVCRRARSSTNAPRVLVEAMDGGDADLVVGVQSNATHTTTEIDLCRRDGALLGKQLYNGYWQPSANVKLVDLDRDRRPDLVRVEAGLYTVMPNAGTSGQLAFDTPRTGLLQPLIAPVATFVQDMNGDGLPDLIVRTDANLTVWLGTGDFGFLTEGATLPIRALSGAAVGNLNRFDFHFVDLNRDGLSDLLLTTSTSAALYVNDGYQLHQVEVPGLGSYGSGATSPVIADLTGSGNTELVFTRGAQAFALELDDAGVGLLATADDGKGTALAFGYARGPAAPGGRQRHSLLQSLTVRTSGLDPITYRYDYGQPEVHSRDKSLLGYDWVRRTLPHGSETVSLLNDDDAAGVLLSSISVDDQLPDVERRQLYGYQATSYQGVSWLRPASEQAGFRSADGTQTLEERTDYLEYEAEVCPKRVQLTSAAGTLTIERQRAEVAALAGALHCTSEWVTHSGAHADARWDFVERKHFQRNALGLPTSIESVAADGTLVLEQVSYNADATIAQVAFPGRGASSFAYDPQTHLLARVTTNEGVQTSVVARDPVRDQILQMRSDRGGAAFTQSFRFDGQERLQKSWNDLGQASEADPLEELAYAYASATRLGSIHTRALVARAEGAVRESVELEDGGGAAIASAQRIPEGWAFGPLTERLRAENETLTLLRPPLGGATDLGQLDLAALTQGAWQVGDAVTTPSGALVRSTSWLSAATQKQLAGGARLQGGQLLRSALENGSFATVDALDAAGRVVAHTDPSGATWGYRHDLLGRLRAVDLPGSGGHRLFLDGHGRPARVERDGIGALTWSYDATSGLPAVETAYGSDGVAARITRYGYDAMGRKTLEESTDPRSGEVQRFSYYYDGATPEAPRAVTLRGVLSAVVGDGYERRLGYRADGKLVRREVRLGGGWRTVITDLELDDAGETRGQTTQVRQNGALLETVSVRQRFDGFGRIAGIDVNGEPAASFLYDAEGQLAGATLPDGARVDLERDAYSRLATGLSQTTSAFVAFDRFVRNARGLIDAESLSTGGQSIGRQYGYTPAGYLSQSTDALADRAYSYEGAGLPASIRVDGDERSLRRGAATLTIGSVSYSFDALGRVVARDGLTLAYGPSGQLARARSGAHEWQYRYDEGGARRLKLTDGAPTAAYLDEGYLDASGLTQPFVVGPLTVGVVRGGRVQLLPVDVRGTITGEADGTARFASPFGERAQTPGLSAALDFVTQGRDPDLGLIRMGARDYDPEIDQFLTPDPLFLAHPEQCLSSPTSCNLYSYARNNPLSYEDPKGTYEEPVHGALTYHLAVAAGLSEKDAAQLALATAAVDHNPATIPIDGWGPGLHNWLTGVTYLHHFNLGAAMLHYRYEVLGNKGADLSAAGTWLHTLEDVYPGGPHAQGVHPVTAHGVYRTEKGSTSWPLSHVSDHASENPTAYTKQLTHVYGMIRALADARCGCEAPHDDAAAARAIQQIVSASTKPQVDKFLDAAPPTATQSYRQWVERNLHGETGFHVEWQWSPTEIDSSIK